MTRFLTRKQISSFRCCERNCLDGKEKQIKLCNDKMTGGLPFELFGNLASAAVELCRVSNDTFRFPNIHKPVCRAAFLFPFRVLQVNDLSLTDNLREIATRLDCENRFDNSHTTVCLSDCTRNIEVNEIRTMASSWKRGAKKLLVGKIVFLWLDGKQLRYGSEQICLTCLSYVFCMAPVTRRLILQDIKREMDDMDVDPQQPVVHDSIDHGVRLTLALQQREEFHSEIEKLFIDRLYHECYDKCIALLPFESNGSLVAFYLGRLLCDPEMLGGSDKRDLGLSWLGKSATLGYTKAYYFLAEYTFNTDDKIHWYTKAANSGDTMSMYDLGTLLLDENRQEEAVSWLKMGVKFSERNCILRLGDCYRDGKGVEKNYKTAMYWYSRIKDIDENSSNSACKAYKKKQYKIGFMYENGFGVEQNIQSAKQYYKNAVDVGNHDLARSALERLS